MSEQNVMDVPAHNAPDDFDGGDFGGGDFDGGNDDGADGSPAAPGMGQSKSSRRRRRKRKNKVAGISAEGAPASSGEEGGEAQPQAQAPSAPVVMEGESLALASNGQPQQQQQQPRRQGFNNGPNGQQQGAGGKRWKKKFGGRDRRPGQNDSPGNDTRPEGSNGGGGYGGGGGYRQNSRPDNFGNLNGGFRRKGKPGGPPQQGRKERGFVGPMDHSYREVNGNFADGPPSTIHVHGGQRRGGHRHHGDSQPIDHSMPRAIPVPENAQTHIYFFIEDLFLTAKIQETARKQGIKVAFVKNEKEAIAEMTSGEVDKPALIVFDLNNANAKPLTLIPKLRTKLKRTASIIGFLSSIQGDLKAKAVEAGCDTVMPRAAFSQNLPNLLRRYSAEEGEEVNFNY